jgi:beta-lactamase superfamily II metal-dependent hydrolase
VVRVLALVAGLMVALTPAHPSLAQASGQLIVRFLDVGQGDAAWLTTPNGSTILIDCGRNGYGPQLVAQLEAANVTRINVLARAMPMPITWAVVAGSSRTVRTFQST